MQFAICKRISFEKQLCVFFIADLSHYLEHKVLMKLSINE